MTKSYNPKTLVKLIKKAAKSHLIWQKKENGEYITNRHWAVKAEEFEPDVKAALYGAFGRECQVGESLYLEKGYLKKGPDVEVLFKPEEATEEGVFTPIVVLGKNKASRDLRLIKFDSGIYWIDNEYAALIDETVTQCRKREDSHMIYFGSGDVVIMPVINKELEGIIKRYLMNEEKSA